VSDARKEKLFGAEEERLRRRQRKVALHIAL
jgi:hypothetical protein